MFVKKIGDWVKIRRPIHSLKRAHVPAKDVSSFNRIERAQLKQDLGNGLYVVEVDDTKQFIVTHKEIVWNASE